MIENPLTKAIAEALLKMEELKYITYNPILNKEVVASAIETEIEKITWKDFIQYVFRR